MIKRLLVLVLSLLPLNLTLAATPDACQLLAKTNPTSVLNCYKNATDSALQSAKNNFIANFIQALSGEKFTPPPVPDGHSNAENTGEKNPPDQIHNSQQKSGANSSVKYY